MSVPLQFLVVDRSRVSPLQESFGRHRNFLARGESSSADDVFFVELCLELTQDCIALHYKLNLLLLLRRLRHNNISSFSLHRRDH